jgi:cell wall-associated NlpC family hydrolase
MMQFRRTTAPAARRVAYRAAVATCAALAAHAVPVGGAAAQGPPPPHSGTEPPAFHAVQRLTPYLSIGGGRTADPLIAGATLGVEAGQLGLRFGGGVDAQSTLLAGFVGLPRTSRPGLWALDADLMVLVAERPAAAVFLPYGLVGLGLRGFMEERAAAGAGGEAVANWSYGGGLRTRVSDLVSLETESRFRHAADDPGPAHRDPLAAGWEHRLGLSLALGGRPHPTIARAPAGPAPLARAPHPADAPVAAGGAAPTPVARRALDAAELHLGTGYRWGGATPTTGFDCSGFVQYVFRKQGIQLPRVSADQARAGAPLPTDLAALRPGDLMFFASNGRRVDHVAIYAGDGRIIHSSRSGGGVRFDDLHASRGRWYVRHFVAARRVLPEEWALDGTEGHAEEGRSMTAGDAAAAAEAAGR